jgi:hypothetical protein
VQRTSDQPRPSPGSVATRSAFDQAAWRATLARTVLQRQQQALRRGSRTDYLQTWASESKAAGSGATVFTNLRRLNASISHIRYVATDQGGSLPAPTTGRFEAGAWTATVHLAWRLRGYDERPALARLRFTFVRHGGKAYVADIASTAGERQPVWLSGRLDVRRTRRTLAAAASRRETDRLQALLTRAVTDVQQAVPDWHGDLVAYEPATAREFASLLAATPSTYDGIAAVTATVDGRSSSRAPVAIFVNPAVFDRLRPVGAHVVISHESTHAATGATFVGLPLWVAEGFADYVALRSVHIPLAVSAAAAIRDISEHGLPRSLPSDAKFNAEGYHLEVYYEQAWLAARLIASQYGKAGLLRFYRSVVAASGGVARALRVELATSPAKFTAQWRAYLRNLPGAA